MYAESKLLSASVGEIQFVPGNGLFQTMSLGYGLTTYGCSGSEAMGPDTRVTARSIAPGLLSIPVPRKIECSVIVWA